MSIYIYLATLCVSVSASAYLGYLSGIHSRRNHAYRKGWQDAMQKVADRLVKVANRGN